MLSFLLFTTQSVVPPPPKRNISLLDHACVGAKQWNRLPLQEKDVWNKQSLESSERYAEKMWLVCRKVRCR